MDFSIEPGQLIVWIIIGALAGFIVGWLVRGRKRGFGALGNTIIGMIGALIGGFLFDVLGVQLNSLALTFTLTDLVAAIVGSLIILGVLALLRR
jgi:uncharacterized membrane protein YeaQ/YmgE (transglycosylase-associated protein family)